MEKDHLRQLVDSIHLGNRAPRFHTVRKTGGSTGKPCLVLVNHRASASSLAARILCQGWYGIQVGDRQIRFWGRPLESSLHKSRAKDYLLNRIRIDSLALERENISMTLQRINSFGADYIYGYTSLIQLFADMANEFNVSQYLSKLKAVISTSETLLPAQKQKLSQSFGCPVVNEYGCSEVDIVSFECPDGGQHIISSNIIVEIKRYGDEPEGFGQVLVTDLNNTMMPVIRYRVGDLAPLEMSECSCGRGWPCLGQVLGRSQGQYIIVPGKGRVHSQFVVYMVEELMAAGVPIGRFKVVQEESDLLVLLVASTHGCELNLGEIMSYVNTEGRAVFGDNMVWRVDLVKPEALKRERNDKYQHFESRIQ